METMVRSIPVYYEEYGVGIPVLMLHGWPSDHRYMAAIFEPLFENRSGWRRIYPDLPGMGKTPGAEWITRHDHMVEVALEFMQIVAPNQRFIVAGLSYGGFLARGLVYQQAALIDGVCMVVPAVEVELAKAHLPPYQVLVEDSRFLAALTPEENNLLGLFSIQNYKDLEILRASAVPAMATADHAFLEKLGMRSGFSFPADKLTSPFPAPALIITGRQDSICGYQDAWAILENYPRGTFAVLDRHGHLPTTGQQGIYQALTNDWLDRVEEYITKSSD